MHLRFPTSLISFRNYKHNDNYTMLKLSYSITRGFNFTIDIKMGYTLLQLQLCNYFKIYEV